METVIEKSIACYNPFYFGNKEINRILFFKDGNVLGETRWFYSNNETPKVIFDFPIQKKLKVDLQTKQAFYVKAPQERYERETKYNLYIHADLVNFKQLGEVVAYDTYTHTSYIKQYSVDLLCTWRDQTEPSLRTITFTAPTVSRSVDKPFQSEINSVKAMLEAKGVKIPSYELHQLLIHFNVTPK
jgi:hypothetical protein